jgi:hypothetical protein
MKINCLSCGHNIELDEAYGDGYEGEIKCFGCEARLEIRTEQNALRSVRLLNQPSPNNAHNRAARSHKSANAGAEGSIARAATHSAGQLEPSSASSGSPHMAPAHSRSL